MEISIIVAVANKGIIGGDNSLLWHLPNDLKRFKALTSGHPIIMGRKTFESLPGILPKRPHIVITRNKAYTLEKATVVTSLDDALTKAATHNTGKVYIIGGGEIYRMGLDIATSLEITEVNADYEGDTTFPTIDTTIWKETERREQQTDERHKHSFSFVTYQKK